jgi:hypothetical protein
MRNAGESIAGAPFRHELKFLMDRAGALALKAALRVVMAPDPHAGADGRYRVRSLYFDDPWDSAWRDKAQGTAARVKYRLRAYGDLTGAWALERKLRTGDLVRKDQARLAGWQAERLAGGDFGFLRDEADPLCREFHYECQSRLLRPKLALDYEREPYTLAAGDTRVTFDENVRALARGMGVSYGGGRGSLADARSPAVAALPPGQVILEVKFTGFLPGAARALLPREGAARAALSKYAMCREALVAFTGAGGDA